MTMPIEVPLVYVTKIYLPMKAMDRIAVPMNTVVRTLPYPHTM